MLTSAKGTLTSGDGSTIKDEVPAMPKQFIGQVAMDEQQPSMAFWEGNFSLCGQQSMSSMDDMDDMSSDIAATPVAALAAVGSTATDSASRNTRMARPRCMGQPSTGKIPDLRAVSSSVASWTCARSTRPLTFQEESYPCLAASECLAAVSLHDVERNPSSRRTRHACGC